MIVTAPTNPLAGGAVSPSRKKPTATLNPSPTLGPINTGMPPAQQPTAMTSPSPAVVNNAVGSSSSMFPATASGGYGTGGYSTSGGFTQNAPAGTTQSYNPWGGKSAKDIFAEYRAKAGIESFSDRQRRMAAERSKNFTGPIMSRI